MQILGPALANVFVTSRLFCVREVNLMNSISKSGVGVLDGRAVRGPGWVRTVSLMMCAGVLVSLMAADFEHYA